MKICCPVRVNIMASVRSTASAALFLRDRFNFQFVLFYVYCEFALLGVGFLHNTEKRAKVGTCCTSVLLLKGH